MLHLTEADKAYIRRMRQYGALVLALEFGVSPQVIRQIWADERSETCHENEGESCHAPSSRRVRAKQDRA